MGSSKEISANKLVWVLLIAFVILITACKATDKTVVERTFSENLIVLPENYAGLFTQANSMVDSWSGKAVFNHADWTMDCTDLFGLPTEANFYYYARIRRFLSSQTYQARAGFDLVLRRIDFSAKDLTKADPPFLSTTAALLDNYPAALEEAMATGGHDFVELYPACDLSVSLGGTRYSFTFMENGPTGNILKIEFVLANGKFLNTKILELGPTSGLRPFCDLSTMTTICP